MKISNIFPLVYLILLTTCQSQTVSNTPKGQIKPASTSILHRVALPDGFERLKPEDHSFAYYLQNFPLKPHQSKVYYYNGKEKHTQDYHVAVLDIDTGHRNLQQCADAVMRLRAEYLYQQKRYEEIVFNFTNGFPASYSRWRAGERIKVDGNKANWYATNKPSTSYEEFRKYLDIIFTYAGTLSLNKELSAKPLNDMQIGDVFIQGGSPGHTVLIVDLAVHQDTGEKIFLIAQSFMPAQDIHILKNNRNPPLYGPWYSLSEIQQSLQTPEWTFYPKDLKSF